MDGKGRTNVIDADSAASALSTNGGIENSKVYVFELSTHHQSLGRVDPIEAGGSITDEAAL